MGRLTKREGDEFTYIESPNNIPKVIEKLAKYEDIGLEPNEIIEALKMKKDGVYELPTVFGKDFVHIKELVNLEEQGRLIKLPCKVGDTVYGITCKGITEYTVYAIIIDSLGIFLKIKPKNDKKLPHAVVIDHSWNIGQIGDKLFLSRQEAEAKLKEVQNG